MAERRVFAGPAVRKVRREAAMTQAAMAEALDISPSYLNLIEHGQRPLSATVIVRLAERFGFDAAKLGAEAVPGGNVTVHYVGVEFDTGEEFDSSWNRGETIEFPLRGLIQGWQDGIPGMRVGGRRKLTIPPAQAYGPAGSGHRLGGKTLIFVIDLLGVR